MVVNFTTNIGLAKPDNNEVAENWVNAIQLTDDNNLIIEDKTDVNLLAYTPVLAAQTTAPSIGAGQSRGEYCDVQGFVFGNFVIEFTDPGVSAGSGEYGISLPFVADNSFHSVGTAFNAAPGQYSCIGEGYMHDATAIATSGNLALDVVTVGGVSYARLITETYSGKTSRIFTNGQPYTLATGDKWSGQFFYKRV